MPKVIPLHLQEAIHQYRKWILDDAIDVVFIHQRHKTCKDVHECIIQDLIRARDKHD